MKKSILLTIIVFGIIIIATAFYWNQWRPSHIISLCAKDAARLADTDMREYYLSQLPILNLPKPTGLDPTKIYTLEEFGREIKANYPEYNDLSDINLAQRLLIKYPEFNGLLTDFEPPVGDPHYDNYHNIRYQNCLKENGLSE